MHYYEDQILNPAWFQLHVQHPKHCMDKLWIISAPILFQSFFVEFKHVFCTRQLQMLRFKSIDCSDKSFLNFKDFSTWFTIK